MARKLALQFGIPLIIWGVNGWLDQVGMFSHFDQAEMTKRVREEHGLRKFDAKMLINEDIHFMIIGSGPEKKDLLNFVKNSKLSNISFFGEMF